jgi:hypothetical protein
MAGSKVGGDDAVKTCFMSWQGLLFRGSWNGTIAQPAALLQVTGSPLWAVASSIRTRIRCPANGAILGHRNADLAATVSTAWKPACLLAFSLSRSIRRLFSIMVVRHLHEPLSVMLMVVVVLSFSEGRASRVVRLWRDDLINDLIDLDDPSPRAYVRRENN